MRFRNSIVRQPTGRTDIDRLTADDPLTQRIIDELQAIYQAPQLPSRAFATYRSRVQDRVTTTMDYGHNEVGYAPARHAGSGEAGVNILTRLLAVAAIVAGLSTLAHHFTQAPTTPKGVNDTVSVNKAMFCKPCAKGIGFTLLVKGATVKGFQQYGPEGAKAELSAK